MSDPEVKAGILDSLHRLADALPRNCAGPLVEGETLHEVKAALGLGECSCTAVGAALRSLHNAGRIRCARPRQGESEHRPYAVYLLK